MAAKFPMTQKQGEHQSHSLEQSGQQCNRHQDQQGQIIQVTSPHLKGLVCWVLWSQAVPLHMTSPRRVAL